MFLSRLCVIFVVVIYHTGQIAAFSPALRSLALRGAQLPASVGTIDASNTVMGVVSMDTAGESRKTPDFLAALSYLGATATEFTLIGVFLHIAQIGGVKFAARLPETLMGSRLQDVVRTVLLSCMFFFLSVRSRVFSPLDNSRPQASKDDPNFKRKVPSWMPPPLAFPIVWTAITVLRTISSVLIFNAAGTILCKPIFALALHLSIGDTWNTINNQERRLGTSAVGVLFVLASVLNVVRTYHDVSPLAARIIAPSAVWLTVATVLVWTIWRINYAAQGKPSLFPSVEEGPPSQWRLPLTTFNS